MFQTTEYAKTIKYGLIPYIEEKIFVFCMKSNKLSIVENKILTLNGDMLYFNLN